MIGGGLDPIPITAETIAVDNLDQRQRQCILYAFAGSLVCSEEFGGPVLDDLARYLELVDLSSPSWSTTLLPLLENTHCIKPFVDDLNIDDKQARARVVLILLHFCLVRFKAYDSRIRVALFRVADAMHIPRLWVCAEESIYIRLLLTEARSDNNASKKKDKKLSRWMKVGAAAAVGAGLMVITGGLAAPAIGLGVSALGITSVGTFLGSATGAAIVTGLFGVGGGGLASYKMHRRVGALSNFGFVPVCNDGSVHLTICISGILLPEFDNAVIWQQLKPDLEQTWADIYCLEWETQALLDAGSAVTDFVGSQASTFVLKEGLKQTVLNSMMAAVALPAVVMSAGYLIDNPWGVLISKADQAGDELAQVLLDGVHGNRPVSLIGFSAGARLILRALETLAERRAFGIIQDVFLLGCPGWSSNWTGIRQVVAGRIVNAYSPEDWTLKYVYRAAAVSFSAFGLKPVEDPSVQNVDVTPITRGKHTNYCRHLAQLIACLNLTGSQALDPSQFIDGLSTGPDQYDDSVESEAD